MVSPDIQNKAGLAEFLESSVQTISCAVEAANRFVNRLVDNLSPNAADAIFDLLSEKYGVQAAESAVSLHDRLARIRERRDFRGFDRVEALDTLAEMIHT